MAAGMRVEFEIFGDKQIDRQFVRFHERASNIRPIGVALYGDFLKIEEKQFQSEGKYGSGGWRPLRPSTLASKRFNGLDPRILHATLALRHSLTVEHDPGAIHDIEADGFRFGSKVLYGRFHQKGRGRRTAPAPFAIGAEAVDVGMPRRPPIELTESRKKSWVRFIQRYIVTGSIETASGNTGLLS